MIHALHRDPPRGSAWKTDVQVGPVNPDDAPGILQVHRIAFQDTYAKVAGVDEQALGEFVARDLVPRKRPYWAEAVRGACWPVARIGQVVIGFCQVLPNETVVTVSGLYVLPEHQGRGVGRLLLERVLDGLNRPATVVLEVVRNTPAVGFYERFGFRVVGDLPTPEPLHRAGFALPLHRMQLDLVPSPGTYGSRL